MTAEEAADPILSIVRGLGTLVTRIGNQKTAATVCIKISGLLTTPSSCSLSKRARKCHNINTDFPDFAKIDDNYYMVSVIAVITDHIAVIYFI
jgi:hypothetical protein